MEVNAFRITRSTYRARATAVRWVMWKTASAVRESASQKDCKNNDAVKTRYIGKSVLTLILWNVFLCQEKLLEKLKKQGTLRGERVREEEEVTLRLSISIVIWILSSDTICQLTQFNTNSEAAMLSKPVGMSDVSTSDKANIRTKLLNLISFEYLWGESLSSLPSDKAQCQNQNVQSYI